MSNYCARSDVYAIGLAPEAFRRPLREVEAVVPSTGVLTLRSHGFAQASPLTPLTLAVASSSTLGAAPAAVPTGASVGALYYGVPVAGSSDLFQISASSAGSPVLTFSDAGAGIFGVVVDHGPYLDAAIVAASAVLDEHARAHDPPIAAPVLPLLAAHLAARIYISTHAANNPAFANLAEAPSWLRSRLDKLLDLWLRGAPLVGAVDASPTIAEQGAVLVPLLGRRYDSRGCDGQDDRA